MDELRNLIESEVRRPRQDGLSTELRNLAQKMGYKFVVAIGQLRQHKEDFTIFRDVRGFNCGFIYDHFAIHQIAVNSMNKIEQLKKENEELKSEIKYINTQVKVASYKLMLAEIQQLKSKLAKAKTSLNNALNYLHWREDDLIGDDFKGDGKLTAEYKNKVSEIEKSISEIGGG